MPESQIFLDGKKLNGWEFSSLQADLNAFRLLCSMRPGTHESNLPKVKGGILRFLNGACICWREGRYGSPSSVSMVVCSEVHQCCMTIYRRGIDDDDMPIVDDCVRMSVCALPLRMPAR